jgi:hypothetical protein
VNVVILQSNYIPWKGYFDLIHDADLFVFLDDVQFTSRDWRTRNKIVTPAGTTWLTIPAGSDTKRLICEVEVRDQGWKPKHRNLIEINYRKAPHFQRYAGLLDFLYDNDETNLSAYNQRAIRYISSLLGIDTEFSDSRRYGAEGRKTERLIQILAKAGATRYISGPAAKDYIDEGLFAEAGIELIYKQYPEYPAYPQRGPEFDPYVSIVDLLFNTGSDAPRYIWG